MNHADLVEKIAEAADMPTATVAQAVEAVVQTIIDALKSGEEVRMTGLGIFDAVAREARPGRNPQTAQSINILPARRCVFEQGKQPRTN